MKPPTYIIARRIFLTLLGLIYLFAFLSLAVQIKGLIGSHGITPAANFLNAIQSRVGLDRYWHLPTLFWFNPSDASLQIVCWSGVGLSLLLIAGIAPTLILFLLWFLYLSLFSVGNVFLGYQWDILLLETGFLTIFLAPLCINMNRRDIAPPSTAVLWLFRWLLFRLTFQSGMVKLLSGDEAWRNFTALNYHYFTQPLPTWIAYYAQQLPEWFQKFSVGMMFFIELVVPFFIFSPRVTRRIACGLLVSLQLLIGLTGNYNFFNLLTIALCVLLLDDDVLEKFLERIFGWWRGPSPALWAPSPRRGEGNSPSPLMGEGQGEGEMGAWPKWIIIPVTTLIIILSITPFLGRLRERSIIPEPLLELSELMSPLHLVSGYGLFAVMTKTRSEISIEGSMDGVNWLPYEFRWKPGDLHGRPKFVEPHQPRLDWQMWFASLSDFRHERWLHNFLHRLLEGSPDVLTLLKTNPFPDQPPKYIRARVADYRFTNLETKKNTGQWWEKGEEQPYSPELSLTGAE